MGIYKRLEAVPDRYRLTHWESVYVGRNVWQEFVATRPTSFDSDHYHATFRKAGQSWKAHMTDRGRHHALARPADVDAWVRTLAATRTLGTVYKEYWIRVEEFYAWLQFHPAHPHLYQPVLMAAAEYEMAGKVWDAKLERTVHVEGEES